MPHWSSARRRGAGLVIPALLVLAGCSAGEARPTASSSSPSPVSPAPVTPGSTAVYDLASFGAVCDGSHDDGPALAAALAAAGTTGGGTVRVPDGVCRIQATEDGTPVRIGSGTVLTGSGAGRSSLLLDPDDSGDYRSLLRVEGAGVTVQDLALRTVDDVTAVLLEVGPGQDVAVLDVLLEGPDPATAGAAVVHGVLLPNDGTLSRLRLSGVTARHLDYGLFQQNSSTATVSGITVEESTFDDNRAEDLSFNAPNGTMRDVVVRNSTFTSGDGMAVSFANVERGLVERSTFDGFGREFVHVEDDSTGIRVSSNEFSGNGTVEVDWYSFVFVVSGSSDVLVEGNTFRTSPSALPFQCVFVGPGGEDSEPPTRVTLRDNEAVLAENTELLRAYGGADVTVET